MAKKNKGKKNASAPAPPTTANSPPGLSAWTAPLFRASSSSVTPSATVIAPTQGLRRLPFGERQYDSDCGSEAPEWQSDDDSEQLDHEHDDDDNDIDPVQCLREEYLAGLIMLREEILTRFTDVEGSTETKFTNTKTYCAVIVPNTLVPINKDKSIQDASITGLEAKVATLERLRAAQTTDMKNLRQRVDYLEGKNRKLETTVETLLVEVQKVEEGRKLAAATQVVTPPTTPGKEVTFRPVPPKTPSRATTPLAQQVLKRNMAKRKERSRSEAMEIDCDHNLNENTAPATGRPAKAPRQSSSTPSLMHSSHVTGVDKGNEKDKGERDQQREARKPRNRKEEGESWRSRRNPKENKDDAGWQEVKRRWRPIGPCTKVNDGRSVTTVWDTRDGRYESWRPHKREPRQQGGGGERR
ncbi:hypothetical protein BDD12DRAFT_880708 [Trichophaea hybrida]|nr:hypothetical protein BDD12DRAFT_880708 [Trichophaea hybrida]